MEVEMGKKSKRQKDQFRNVLRSLKDLGGDGKDTLSRLATTVKADAPTLILGNNLSPSGTVRNPGYVSPFGVPAAQPKSRLNRLAQKMVPFRRTPLAAWNDRKASKKLKKLAKQMAKGKTSMIKIRRSRLPLVAALLIVALGFGGYYVYRSITMPKVHVTKYLDYKKWLNTTSGNVKPQAKVHVVTSKHYGKHSGKHSSKHGKSKYAHGKTSSRKHAVARLDKKRHGKGATLAKGHKAKGKSSAKRASYRRAE